MSQNTDYYQLVTSSSSSTSPSTSHQRNKHLSSNQTFLATPSECSTTPSSIVSTVQNDSPPSRTSPIVSDVCVTSLNGVRNTSTTTKLKDHASSNGNHSQDKYGFTLDFASSMAKVRKEPAPPPKSQFYQFEMNTNDEEDLHSPFELDVPLCEHQPLKKIQNEFLIDRMLKDDDNRSYRSSNQSQCSPSLSHPSPLVTPSGDHRDIDALSDAGTYIIEDDGDIAQDDEPERDMEPVHDSNDQASVSSSSVSSPFRRYATTKRARHGTFDIHGLVSNNVPAVNRPIVDSNPPHRDLSSPSSSSSSRHSSSSSSLLSLPTESDHSVRKEPEGASHHTMDDQSSNGLAYTRQRPTTLLQQKRSITPPQNPIKPAECFVISPTFETKTFSGTAPLAAPRRKVEPPWKPKTVVWTDPMKDSNVETTLKKSPPSPPTAVRVNPNDPGKYSFRLQQNSHVQEPKPQPSQPKPAAVNTETRATVRPHPNVQEQTYGLSPFQRNASVRQTMPANSQYQRGLSSSVTTGTSASTNKYADDPDEMLSSHPSLTKVYMNKSFALRRQRSNLVPSTVKSAPSQPQPQPQPQPSVPKSLLSRQMLKGTTSVPSTSLLASSISNAGGQTNRAVELRRARAQAKIEELAQRTRHQLQKTEHHGDVMSSSWHSNASSSSKKDSLQLRSNIRSTYAQIPSQKQDLSKTRTISSSSHHRSSSASPNPLGETAASSRYRKAMVSSVTDESTYQKMNGSTYSEGERCDSLRDDGQRLAIKLIQISSGILAKLKPNNTAMDNDSSVRELEQLVDKLQTVNRALSTIDASLTTPTSDESLI